MGKTRLALEVAGRVLEAFPDGVWMVDLAGLADPAFIPDAVASVVSVSHESGVPRAEALLKALRHKQLLLVLDNCEHLLTACATLTDHLLRACPNLRMLATSREPLGLVGEAVCGVPSLSLPDPGERPSMERLMQYEAVRLFVERAVDAAADFRMTPDNASAITHVCLRLDGIPLALELAAARVRVLSIEQIAARLEDRFALLTGGSRTAVPRQQTLQRTVDWSYDLLSEAERTLLRRLAVFAGGWTLQAAEAVCSDDGEQGGGARGRPADGRISFSLSATLSRQSILDLLSRLIDKSLVLAHGQGKGTRYRMLETIRQYAWERLTESDEKSVLQERHLAFFLAQAEEARLELSGPAQASWFETLESDHENFRSALRGAIDGGNAGG